MGRGGERGWWKYTRAYPIADLPFGPRERIASSTATATAAEEAATAAVAAAVPGARGSGSHAAASAAAAATVAAVDSSRWITRRRG